MKKFSTYLLVMFMIVFWIIRIIITIASQMGKDFLGMTPINEGFEIAVTSTLFQNKDWMVTFMANLSSNRSKITELSEDVTNKLSIMSHDALTVAQSTDLMFSMIGIILPLAVLIDLLLDKNRKENPTDKKTDWFYKNEEFDRKLDDRADKNNYRTL